jgi:simple sugar transport system permease protein
MSQSVSTKPSSRQVAAAERNSVSLLHRAMARPEVGAFIAAVAIFIFFSIVATPFHQLTSLSTVLYASSQIGIVAVAVTLLMIGGEFDLSAGVAVITAGLTASMLSYQFTLNMWVGAIAALALALLIGFINGYLVVKTGIPSFLVTLGSFFVLQGANLGVTKMVSGSVATNDVSNIAGFDSLHKVFASSWTVGGVTIRVTVLWWLLFVALATWILLRTRIGNWIFAVGGNADSARAVGVPVAKVKIGLFMAVGVLAWFYGMHRLFAFNTIQAGVGGTLLTGGYGSALGGAIGAFIFGMTTQGIVYAGWDPNWFKAFLGVMLLLAVMVNLYVRKLATKRR